MFSFVKKKKTKLSFQLIVLVYIPTTDQWEFLLLHMLTRIWDCYFLDLAIPIGIWWYISLFPFATPWWHIMLSIFLYVCLPSVLLLWWDICSDILSIFYWFISLLLSFKSFLNFCMLVLNHMCVCKDFLSIYGLSSFS